MCNATIVCLCVCMHMRTSVSVRVRACVTIVVHTVMYVVIGILRNMPVFKGTLNADYMYMCDATIVCVCVSRRTEYVRERARACVRD